MDNLIKTFHLDFKLLLAQAVNFAIVFSVLYFFAIKPLTKVMRERTKKIEKSVKDAAEIEKRLSLTEKEYEQELAKAKKEAHLIMEKAISLGENKREEMIKKAKEEIGQIINDEKKKIQQEKGRTLQEIKKEVAELVILSMEKILKKNIGDKENKEMIKELLKNRG